MSFKAKQPSDEQLSFIGPSPYILQPDLASTFTQGDGCSSRTRWVGEDMAKLEGRVFFVLPGPLLCGRHPMASDAPEAGLDATRTW